MAYTDQIPDLCFLDLLDAPDGFSGHGQYVVVVNAAESALEFVEYVAAHKLLGKELDTNPPTNGQILVFNSTSDKWEAQDHSHTQFVLKIGDSMSGFLTLHADPTSAFHAATKQYVDNTSVVVAANIGAGVGVYEKKVGNQLQFNSLISANGYLAIAEDDGNDEIDFTINHSAIEEDISHLNIQDIGTNTHAQIDTHIAATNNPHSVTATQVGKDTAQWNADELQDWPISTTDPWNGSILRLTNGVWEPYELIVGAEHSCKLHLTSDQAIPEHTWTAIDFDAYVWDTQTYWSVSYPSRMTIPTGNSGRYALRANVIWELVQEDVSTQSRLYVNGNAITASHSGQYITRSAGGNVWLPTANLIAYDMWLDAGDYVELYVWCSASLLSYIDALGNSDENYSTWMSLERIE